MRRNGVGLMGAVLAFSACAAGIQRSEINAEEWVIKTYDTERYVDGAITAGEDVRLTALTKQNAAVFMVEDVTRPGDTGMRVRFFVRGLGHPLVLEGGRLRVSASSGPGAATEFIIMEQGEAGERVSIPYNVQLQVASGGGYLVVQGDEIGSSNGQGDTFQLVNLRG